MSEELLERAKAGDREAFDELVRPRRAELQAHCYRMLGSSHDAEDAAQETLLSAWLGLDGFEGRSSVRTWLYRIATNRCLNLLRSAKTRAGKGTDSAPSVTPTAMSEVPWLQPYPDVLLEGIPDDAPGPDSRYESQEAISLAFVRALQLLPPNQRAALLIRDVLGYRAAEAADLLGVTVDALNGALKRARSTMATSGPASSRGSSQEFDQELVDRFVADFTSGNVEGLVALLTDDVWIRMPPLPFEYQGGDAVRALLESVSAHLSTIELRVPVGANCQPAWGEYVRDPATGSLHLIGILVIGMQGGLISEVTHFDTAAASFSGLPRTLESPSSR
jgi:RNA polymerase sigma-70 factor (ECF subfamily)